MKNKWILMVTVALSLILLVSAAFAFDNGIIGTKKQSLKEDNSKGKYYETKNPEPLKQGPESNSNQEKQHETVNVEPVKQNPKEESNQEPGRENALSPVDAFDKYMAKYPGTKVKEVELEAKGDYYVYEIEGYDKNNKYELKIHSTSGKILKEEVKKGKGGGYGEITRKDLEKVPALVASALKDAGKGALLYEWELEFDDGILELEVEIKIEGQNKKIEYEYNLETGKLLDKEIKKIK